MQELQQPQPRAPRSGPPLRTRPRAAGKAGALRQSVGLPPVRSPRGAGWQSEDCPVPVASESAAQTPARRAPVPLHPAGLSSARRLRPGRGALLLQAEKCAQPPSPGLDGAPGQGRGRAGYLPAPGRGRLGGARSASASSWRGRRAAPWPEDGAKRAPTRPARPLSRRGGVVRRGGGGGGGSPPVLLRKGRGSDTGAQGPDRCRRRLLLAARLGWSGPSPHALRGAPPPPSFPKAESRPAAPGLLERGGPRHARCPRG